MKTTLFMKRRMFVNKKFGDLTRGMSYTKKKKTKLLKLLWKEAKKRFK